MKYKILLVLFSVCLLMSTLIATVPVSNLCGVEEKNSCNMVQNSSYSKLFGMNVSSWGIVFFWLLMVLTMVHMRRHSFLIRKIIFGLTAVAAAFALYFLYVQAFIIGAFCKYCLVVDVVCLVSLLVAFFYAE